MSNIRIDIASEFKDKGFKKADRAASALDAKFERLGRTILTVFSVQQVTRFAKAAVDGFKEDERAAVRFEQALKGVNLGFAAPEITTYLNTLEKQTGILKDDLMPAYQSLAQTTRSVYKSQDILNTAIDTAAGTGIDLNTVVRDLTRSYVGNNAGLAKYNLGLSKAELRTTSFAKVQELLNKQFSGQRAAYLETYAGKTDMLRVSYDLMSDSIGEGLVDAFGMLAGENGIGGATTAMEQFGVAASDAIRGLGVLVSSVQTRIPLLDQLQYLSQFPQIMTLVDKLMDLGKGQRPLFFPSAGIGQPGVDKRLAAIEEAAIKRQKELEALRLKALREQEKANRLKRISIQLMEKEKKFDLTRIQLQAALQGKLTAEEQNRVKELMLIEETKQAIAEQNVDKAEELMEKLKKLQDETISLAGKLTEFPKANDPFADWTKSLNAVQLQLSAIQQKKIVVDFIQNFVAGPSSIATPSNAASQAASASAAAAAAAAAKAMAEADALAAAAAKATEAAKAAEAKALADAKAASEAAAKIAADAAAKAAADVAAANAAAQDAIDKLLSDSAAAKAAAAAAELEAQKALADAAAALAAAKSEEERKAAEAAAKAAEEAAAAAKVIEDSAAALAAAAASAGLTDAGLTLNESIVGAAAAGVAPITIIVNVEGNVTAEDDLAETIYDTFLDFQKSGKGLLYSNKVI